MPPFHTEIIKPYPSRPFTISREVKDTPFHFAYLNIEKNFSIHDSCLCPYRCSTPVKDGQIEIYNLQIY